MPVFATSTQNAHHGIMSGNYGNMSWVFIEKYLKSLSQNKNFYIV